MIYHFLLNSKFYRPTCRPELVEGRIIELNKCISLCFNSKLGDLGDRQLVTRCIRHHQRHLPVLTASLAGDVCLRPGYTTKQDFKRRDTL